MLRRRRPTVPERVRPTAAITAQIGRWAPVTGGQTLRSFLWRAEHLYPDREIVARTGEGTTRQSYAEYGSRVRQLANAVAGAGIGPGDRVGTVCWNTAEHFETYFGVPNLGAQLHTINPLLPADQIRHIVADAGDRLLFVDPSLAEPVAAAAADADGAFESVEQFVFTGASVPDVGLTPATDYESFLAGHAETIEWPDLEDDQPAGMCYTSGTTGLPKGVEYTHEMLWSHTMALLTPQAMCIEDTDVVMPVVPMFHVNAWGMPFAATAAGAKQVYPGPAPDPADLIELIEREGVTLAAGVPTVWLDVLDHAAETGADLATLDRVVVGGAAAPRTLIEEFTTYDVDVLHAWGMTELTPLGSLATIKYDRRDASEDRQIETRTTQGLLAPGLECRVVDDAGSEVPWDGETYGELLVRGPWVAEEYHNRPAATEAAFEGSWLRTGDIVTIDADGYIEIVDRTDDMIKSGGEWISSVELENAIMAHEAVREAAVIGVSDERWGERPVAMVVLAEPADADREQLVAELQDRLAEAYPDWWVPDAVEFIEEVPKTATGKFSKQTLRDRYREPDPEAYDMTLD